MGSRRGFLQLIPALAAAPCIPVQKRIEHIPTDCGFSFVGYEYGYAVYFEKFREHPEILHVNPIDIVTARMVLRNAACEYLKVEVLPAQSEYGWSLEGKHGIVYSGGA